MYMKRAGFFASICLVLLTPAVVVATDYSSTNFKVQDPVIDELGGYSSSTSFGLYGDIPFISPRQGSSASYLSIPGFLGFPAPAAATTTPTSTPPQGPGGSSGGGGPPGAIPPKPQPTPRPLRKTVDFNRDGYVNFIDFSILLYYYDKSGAIIVPYDLNDDGAVDIVDISIFMYYWDGTDFQTPIEIRT